MAVLRPIEAIEAARKHLVAKRKTVAPPRPRVRTLPQRVPHEYTPKDDTPAWLKHWKAAYARVVSQHSAAWKLNRHERMATALNRVESRKRELVRERAAKDAKDKEAKEQRDRAAREREIAARASGPNSAVQWAKAVPGVSDAAIRDSQKKIGHENQLKHLEEQRQREALIRQQQAEKEAALEVARKLDRAMRLDITDPQSGA